jgi:AraC-like DNA-binding protein
MLWLSSRQTESGALTNSSDDEPAAGQNRAFFGSFSTDFFSKGEEIEGWNHIAQSSGFQVRQETPGGQPLRATAIVRALPGLAVVSGSTTPLRTGWSESQILNDDVIVCFSHGGGIVSMQRGREEMTSGAGAVVMGLETAGSTFFTGGGLTTLRAPRRAFSRFADDGRLFNRQLSAGDGALKLLKTYLTVLENPSAIATTRQQDMVVSHVHDLLALAVGAGGDERRAAIERGGAAARLHALKTDIDRHLFERQLGAKFLARTNGVTPRHVHRLFEAEGASLSQYVLERRLLEAYRLLAAPEGEGRTVADIAFAIGFNDLSYFNRAFARRFEAKPGEVRSLFGTSRTKRGYLV